MLVFSQQSTVNENSADGNATKTTEISQTQYELQLEERLKQIVSQVDGAGKCEVMVTLKSGKENKYAMNSVIENQSSDGKSQSKSDNEYVVIDTSSGDSCVILKTEFPEIQGVIIVCQGGENSKVKNDVINAVSALLGIKINHISVLKMKSTEE